MKWLKRDFITPLLSKQWAIPDKGYQVQIDTRLLHEREDETVSVLPDKVHIQAFLPTEMLTYHYCWDKQNEKLVETAVDGWF